MKIVYTPSAIAELERFQDQRKDDLESIIKREKYVFGDESVEITASDIRAAERQFSRLSTPRAQLPLTKLLMRLYLFAGVAMVVAGLFYEEIRSVLEGDPVKRTLVIGGLALSFVSIVGGYYVRIRTERRELMERHYREYESRLRSESEDRG